MSQRWATANYWQTAVHCTATNDATFFWIIGSSVLTEFVLLAWKGCQGNERTPSPGRSNEPVDFRSNWGTLRGKWRLWVPSSVLCVKLHSLGSCSEWLSVRNTEKEQPPCVRREEYYEKVQFPGDTFVLCKHQLWQRWKSWVFLFCPGSILSAEETAVKKISLMMLPIPQISATEKRWQSGRSSKRLLWS